MSGAADLPPCPPSLKPIQHYLKTASEHESRDVVVVYWCRLFSLQSALEIDKKSDEARLLLVKLMDWLEKKKKELCDNEAITNDIAAQAHIENYALKLFYWADNQDQAGVYNKNVVKAFYTAGMLMDVLKIFGELGEDIESKCKYSKWRASDIHNCLKNGQIPERSHIGFSDENLTDVDPTIEIDNSKTETVDTNINSDESSSNFTEEWNPRPSVIVPSPVPAVSPAVTPTYNPPSTDFTSNISSGSVKLEPAKITKAQKYCKFAASALNYDDVSEAINNLQKALKLLTTGEDG